jgi:hypothetical protein
MNLLVAELIILLPYLFGYQALGADDGAPVGETALSLEPPPALCPLNVRVGENSPSLCPTIFSVTYTGMNFFPL